MQATIFKYIQLFCVPVLFVNVSCDSITLKNYQNDFLFYGAACAASCMEKSNGTLRECYEHECETNPQRLNFADFKMNLRCRDDTSLLIEIVDDNAEGSKHRVEFRRIVECACTRKDRLCYSTLIQITDLMPNRTYNITATLMHSNYQYSNAVHLDLIKTLPADYSAAKIKSSQYKLELSKASNKMLDVFITWEPAEDRTCHYFIQTFRPEDPINIHTELVSKPELLYHYAIYNQTFGIGKTSVGIQGTNKEGDESSDIDWIDIQTPTCWDWYTDDINLDICPPYQPSKIVVEQSPISLNNLYRMNVSWESPQRQPRSYISDDNLYTRNVSGESTHEVFEDIQLFGDTYDVKITAISLGGNSSAVIEKSMDKVIESKTRIESLQKNTQTKLPKRANSLLL